MLGFTGIMRYPWLCMYAETPWLGRRGFEESPTTAMVLERRSRSAIGSGCGGEAIVVSYLLFASSTFCLNILDARLRTVSETSLLEARFLRSPVNRFFMSPRARSSG